MKRGLFAKLVVVACISVRDKNYSLLIFSYLLKLAETMKRYPEMIAATDKQYGEGVTMYIVNAIREHYGGS